MGTSIAAIATGAGVSQGALHFHFRTKHQIALAVIDEQNVRTFAAVDPVDPSPIAGLVRVSRHMVDLLLADPVVRAGIRLSLDNEVFAGATSSAYDQWINGVADEFRRAVAVGELRTELTAEQLGATMVSYFTGVQLVSRVRTGHADLFGAVRTIWTVLLDGVVDQAHRARLRGTVDAAFGTRS